MGREEREKVSASQEVKKNDRYRGVEPVIFLFRGKYGIHRN